MAFMGGKSSGWPKRFPIAALTTAVSSGLGFNPEAMWGPPGDRAWARNDPTVQAGRLGAQA